MKKSIIFLLILLCMSSLSVLNTDAGPKAETYIVVYDEAHLQLFTHDLLNTALTGLNESFDVKNEIDVTIELVVNKENFTDSNLQGADLVLIPSPNLRADKSSNVDTQSRITEESALNTFLSIGGSILYMSNPYSMNASLAGHFIPMNELIVDDLGFNVMQGVPGASPGGTLDIDNVTVIIDDFTNDGNNSHVYFTGKNVNGDIWDKELNEISEILYYGSQIDLNSGSTHFGNASALTYSVNKEYEIILKDPGNVRWMAGNSFGSSDGRGALIGSTIMFSDMVYANETTWVDVGDNQELFANIVAWLLNITPLNKPVDKVDRDFSYFLTRNVMLSILLPAALLVIVFGTLIKTNAISAKRVFTFRIKQKGVKKSKSSAEGAVVTKTTTKSTKKTPKKQRRKRN